MTGAAARTERRWRPLPLLVALAFMPLAPGVDTGQALALDVCAELRGLLDFSRIVALVEPPAHLACAAPTESASEPGARLLPGPRGGIVTAWDPTVSAPCPRGCAYLLGGANGTQQLEGENLHATVLRSDLESGTVTAVGSIPARCCAPALWLETSLCPRGCIYVFGGRTANGVTDEILQYDPRTGKSLVAARLPSERCCSSAVWDGRHAYVFGGLGPRNHEYLAVLQRPDPLALESLDDILRFEPLSLEVRRMEEPSPGARRRGDAEHDVCRQATLAATLLVAGNAGNALPVQTDACEGRRGNVGALPEPRSFSMAVWDPTDLPQEGCRGGCAYIFGGAVPTDALVKTFSTDILRYNPTTNEVRNLAAAPSCPRTQDARFPVIGVERLSVTGVPCPDRVDPVAACAQAGNALAADVGTDPTAAFQACAAFDGAGRLPVPFCCGSAVWDARRRPDDGCPRGCAYLLGGSRVEWNAGSPERSFSMTLVSLGTVVRYEPRSNHAALLPQATIPARESSVAWNGDRAYLFGGVSRDLRLRGGTIDALHTEFLDDVVVFDPLGRSSSIVKRDDPIVRRTGASAVWDPRPSPGCPDGCAYVFGGWNPLGYQDAVARVDPTSGATSQPGWHVTPGRVGAAAGWNGTHAVLFGGFTCFPCRFLGDVTAVDPATGASSAVVQLPSPRWGGGVASYPASGDCDAGCFYLFGGRDGALNLLDDIVKVDVDAGTAEKVGRLPSQREGVAAAYHPAPTPACPGGCIYLFGGKAAGGPLRDVLAFDPVTRTVVDLAAAPHGDSRARLPAGLAFAAAAIDGSRVYVAGGERSGGAYSDDVLWFLPEANAVERRGARLPTPRCCVAGVEGPADWLLVGGWDHAPVDEVLHYRAPALDANSGRAGSQILVTWKIPAEPLEEWRLYDGRNLTEADQNRTADAPLAVLAGTTSHFVHEVGVDQWRCYRAVGRGPSGETLTNEACGRSGHAPSQPRDVTAHGKPRRLNAEHVLVTWAAPSDEGGRPMTGYRVVRFAIDPAASPSPDALLPTSVREFAPVGPDARSFRDTTLQPGTRAFSYCVVAMNDVGASPAPKPPNASTRPGETGFLVDARAAPPENGCTPFLLVVRAP